MRKTLITATASLVAIALAWAGPAIAMRRPPVREVASFAVTETLPDEVCGFPMKFRVVGRTTTKVYVDANGDTVRATSTGSIAIRFTRTDTGASERYSVSGPSFYDADGTLLRGTGPWFVFTAAGVPAVAVGNLTFDENGAPEDPSHEIDVCGALAEA